jgi:hypothetical protein
MTNVPDIPIAVPMRDLFYFVRKAYADEDVVASEPKLKAPVADVDNWG